MLNFKNSIGSALFVAGLLSIMLGGVAYAQEEQSGEVQIATAEVLTDAERQAILQEIAMQLEEIEREVAELSLLVNKFVLERQALALQEQIEQEQARLVTGETPAPEPVAQEQADEVVVTEEPTQSTEGIAAVPPESSEAGFGQEDIFAGVEITEEHEEQQGFLAALRAFGRNLGTPELVTIAILAFLAVLVLLRRLKGRRARVGRAEKLQSQPQAPEENAERLRQELRERISW